MESYGDNPFDWPNGPKKNARTLYHWISDARMDADMILRFFDLPPSIMRRMLRSKQLRKKLALRREIAEMVVEQHRLNWMRTVAERLIEIMQERGSEATRKACENLLRGSAMPKQKRRPRGRGGKSAARRTPAEPGRDAGAPEAGDPVLRLAELEQALEHASK